MSTDFKWSPYADFEPEQRWEQGGGPLKPNLKTIGVYVSDYIRANGYVTPAEARWLAQTLIDAADAAEGDDTGCP